MRVTNQISLSKAPAAAPLDREVERKVCEAISCFLSFVKPIITEAVKDASTPLPLSPAPSTAKRLTKQEAAAFLSCSLSTISNRMRGGKLKYYSSGRRIYFTEEDLLASLKPVNDFS